MKFMLLFIYLNLGNPDLHNYRLLMDASLSNAETADRFHDKMERVTTNDAAILLGFKAMSEFLKAKHLINPFSKLSHFNKGKKLLEAAIKKEPLSAELIYFRFTTQNNVPSILKYSGQLLLDKQRLIQYLKVNLQGPQADKDLYKRIKQYLLISKHTSAEEKAAIREF